MDKREQNISVQNRELIKISGVKNVDNYDDKQILLQTVLGNLLLTGENLTIKGLNLEKGDLEVTGYIESISYTEEQGAKTKGFLKKLLK